MDWLLKKQDNIEKKLAKKHLKEGALVLYDLTSVYMEGTKCPLSNYGYSRDNKKGKLQIEFGLLTNRDGCPVAVEVFEGNAADPSTVSHQIDKLRHKFGLKKIIFVGDRGMVTQTNKDLKPFGIDWISALRKPSLKTIMKTRGESMQTSLFDTRNICEVKSDEYPGMRLIICHNPYREATRRRKRKDALKRAEKDLAVVQKAIQRRKYALTLKGRQKITERVLRILNRHHVKPFFDIEIEENSLTYSRNEQAITEENNIDGLFVVTTSLSKREMSAKKVVSSYKHLARVERAFRSLKGVDIKVRPVHHRLEGRVKAHIFLCVLAYYVEWHMKQALKPLLFDDEDLSPEYSVTSKEKSDSAKRKASIRYNSKGFRVQTFSSLIKDLATISMCWMKFEDHKSLITATALPTPVQKEVFKQLKVKLNRKS